jgi:hypothetical protein
VSQSSSRSYEWSSIGLQGHAVQFYNHDDHLVDLLSRHVGTALVGGDAAVVIATKAHQDLLAARLLARGFDVRVAEADGRYLALDAAETLSTFMRDGWPDETLFHQAVVRALSHVTSTGGAEMRVAAYGEMVALLWASGNGDAAIRLEEMWNDVILSRRLSLCCAYPMSLFKDAEPARFLRICAQHTCVFPARPVPKQEGLRAQG